MYLKSRVRPFSRPAVLRGRKFNGKHNTQTVLPICFIPAKFVLLSLTLTLPGGHKVSAKKNQVA